MRTPTSILTIAPDRGGKVAMRHGRHAEPASDDLCRPGREAWRFVAVVQAIAGQQVAPIKSSAIGRTGDGDLAIAVDVAHGEQGQSNA
jgi:hypothetical protein